MASMGDRRGAYRVLVGRPEGKRPFGIPRRRWEDNMIYDIFVNCNWVVTRWQYTFTHKQYIEQYKTNNIYNKTILEECGPCPVLASTTLAFALNRGKSTEKPQSG